MQYIYVTVKLTLQDDCDPDYVVQEMDYAFKYGNDIVDTEITDIVSVTDRCRRWIKGNG